MSAEVTTRATPNKNKVLSPVQPLSLVGGANSTTISPKLRVQPDTHPGPREILAWHLNLANQLLDAAHQILTNNDGERSGAATLAKPADLWFDLNQLMAEVATCFARRVRNSPDWWLYRGFNLDQDEDDGQLYLMLYSAF